MSGIRFCFIDGEKQFILMTRDSDMTSDIEESYVNQEYEIYHVKLSWKELHEIAHLMLKHHCTLRNSRGRGALQ